MTQTSAEAASTTWIVVSTCDSYRDAWPPFFTLLERYWPDCPFPVAVVTESKTVAEANPNTRWIHVGADRGWATNLRFALDQLNAKDIIYLQEDYFLQSRVDTPRLLDLIQFAKSHGAGYLRLAGKPEPSELVDDTRGVGIVPPGVKFRCSLQAAWWNVDVLRQLMVDGETGWDMEIWGSERSANLAQPFLALQYPDTALDYYFQTAIFKGKWMPAALRLCRREGIAVDTTARPIQSEWPILWKEFRKSRPIRAVRELFQRKAG